MAGEPYRVEVDREPARLLRSKRIPATDRMRLAPELEPGISRAGITVYSVAGWGTTG